MIELDSPQSVREQLNTGVAGLHCREDMRARIIMRQEQRTVQRPWAVPVMAAAILVIAVLGIVGLTRRPFRGNDFYAIEAGGAAIVTARPVLEHDFILTVEDDHAILIHNGKLYRMTRMLNSLSIPGTRIGEVTKYSENPYDLSSGENDYISNSVMKGDPIFAIEGLAPTTAVMAEVDGQMALFQRSGEHGFGLNGDSLLDTCAVLGQIATISLDGVGKLEGEKAEQAMTVLINDARLENAEALPGEQRLMITLKNGLQLELSMSGDQLIGCGVWDCAKFLDVFRALVAECAPDQAV